MKVMSPGTFTRGPRAAAVGILWLSSLVSAMPLHAADRPDADPPDTARTLDAAISLALAHSPLLSSVRYELEASRARYDQAGQRPQWELSATVENILGRRDLSGMQGAETTVEIGRTLERGGKRAARQDVAIRDSFVLAEEVAVRQRDLTADVTGRFTDSLEQQALAEIRDQEVQFIESLLPVAQRRAVSGRASRAEQASLRAALARAQLALTQTQTSHQLAQRALATLIGQSDWNTGALQGDLTAIAPLPPETTVLEKIGSAPLVRAAQRSIDLAQARVQAAQATSTPDMHIAAGARHLQELQTQALVLSWSLPLGSARYSRPVIREANAMLAVSKARAGEARAQLDLAIGDTWAEAQSSFRAVKGLENAVLPAAQDAAEVLDHGYRVGRFSLLEVTAARQQVIDTLIELTHERARYQRARAVLDRLLGTARLPAAPGSAAQMESTHGP